MSDKGVDIRSWEDGYRVPPQSLAIFRQLFGAGLLVLLLPRFQWIAQFPDGFFYPPPGLTAFFSGFPPRSYFVVIDVLLIAAAVFLIAGRTVTAASWVITCGLLAGNMWAYSFGKIDHDILLVVLPAFLAWAGWDGNRGSRALPMASLACVISLAMAFGAWQKLSTGWLDTSRSAVLGHSVAFAVMAGTPRVFPPAVRYLPGATWELMDWATVAFEFAFILVVFRPPLFRAVCGFACFFHVVVALLMPITFLHNIPAYAAFVDWNNLLRRSGFAELVGRIGRWLSERSTWHLIAASSVLSVAYLRWGNPLGLATATLGPQYASLPRQLALWIAAAGVVILIVLRLANRTSVKDTVDLRVATNDDAPGVARLINQAFRVEDFFKVGDRTTAAGIVELMGAGEFLVVDGDDGEPAVAVYVSRSDGRGYFGMLSVDPRVQGRGLARLVIDLVEDRCRRAGCAWMDIDVVSLRPELTGFYRKLGYSESGTKEFPHPEELTQPCHLIVMTKAL